MQAGVVSSAKAALKLETDRKRKANAVKKIFSQHDMKLLAQR